MKMNTENTVKMILAICDKTISARDELCKLDSFVGDGDHGFTVERGFSKVRKEITEQSFQSPKEALAFAGDTLSEAMGGAIGLIIGGLFTGGAENLTDDEMDTQAMGGFLCGGLEEIKLVGGASEGDRTLIDALSPACDAYRSELDSGADMAQCLDKAALAAEKGAQSTANMIAKRGRARFLKNESLGYVDAGAVTMSKVIAAMHEYVKEIR